MTDPKKHHWWPQLQSKFWIDDSGFITAVRADGSFFRGQPENIGAEGHLYTRYEISGQKDLTIEKWFAAEIEGPFKEILERVATLDGIKVAWEIGRDTAKEKEVKELGFKVPQRAEVLPVTTEHRHAINCYLAALLVRNPIYLQKLIRFHDDHGSPLDSDLPRNQAIKTIALENMLSVYEIYRDRIAEAHIGLVLAEGSHEFLFGDCGITAKEPWLDGPIPFDIHAPLTPTLSLEVLPVPFGEVPGLMVMRANNRGTDRLNRIVLGQSERFVFCRGNPPTKFIQRYFGKPAPAAIAHRIVNGRLETKYDRRRDRS